MDIKKICLLCQKEKSLSNFSLNSKTKDKRQSYCSDCAAEYKKQHYQKNKIEYQIKAKHWYNQNKDYIRPYNSEYRKTYSKRPIVKIRRNLRKRIKEVLFSPTERKSARIGCTTSFLKAYIEKQFREGMSWDNYGSIWHIDHIKPLSSFNLFNPQELALANHYTNLQPLFVEENLKKSDNYTI